MWFKQLQIFQIQDEKPFVFEHVLEKLAPLAFRPCLPSLPNSFGWVAPLDEDDAELARMVHGNLTLCLQSEEKLLPAIVIRQELLKKIKALEKAQDRKVGQKEKLQLKDEIVISLLPRAFSKFSRTYAYINTKNSTLVLGTKNPKKTEQFISLFKKSLSEHVHPLEVNQVSTTITHWLQHQNHPTSFAIEKSAVFQDPQQKQRVVRCQQQNLFAQSIQQLVTEGCQVKQLAFSWQDRINFILNADFTLSAIKYNDEITAQSKEMEAETRQQQFDADVYIMSESLSALLHELQAEFIEKNEALTS